MKMLPATAIRLMPVPGMKETGAAPPAGLADKVSPLNPTTGPPLEVAEGVALAADRMDARVALPKYGVCAPQG